MLRTFWVGSAGASSADVPEKTRTGTGVDAARAAPTSEL